MKKIRFWLCFTALLLGLAGNMTVGLAAMDMVQVEGGLFMMGQLGEEDPDLPVHQVKVDSFSIGKYEVTYEQYDVFCQATGKPLTGDDGRGRGKRPAAYVSWLDAVKFCNWLSQQEGLTPAYTINGSNVQCNFRSNGYRLPTEAEWEYAAKGGKYSKEYRYSGSNDLMAVAWDRLNSGSQTHPVGEKQANELGLYDMSGNVFEWCWDWYDTTYYKQCNREGIVNNPKGVSSSGKKVLRGASCEYSAKLDYIATRYFAKGVGSMASDIGFRVARSY